MRQTYGSWFRIKKAGICFLVLIGLISSCGDEISPVSPIADVVVQEQVNLNSVAAQELKIGDGRFVYILGGIKGIVLYRKSSDIYLAFERKSPYKQEDTCGIITVPSSRFYMEDTCHKCTFGWDGRPQSGPCRNILKQYKVQFINSNTLSITNP